jgi:hypothetical protein
MGGFYCGFVPASLFDSTARASRLFRFFGVLRS